MAQNKEIKTVVKIDPILLNRINNFILKEENRLKYVNKKQFIDLAVSQYLNSLEVKND